MSLLGCCCDGFVLDFNCCYLGPELVLVVCDGGGVFYDWLACVFECMFGVLLCLLYGMVVLCRAGAGVL